MGTFEAFYNSPLQHPFFLWGGALLAIGYCVSLRDIDSSMRRYCLGLGALSLLDAWLSSAHIYGIGSLSGWAASTVPLFFVLAGDFRFLLLAGAAADNGRISLTARNVGIAALITIIVPLSTQGLLMMLPEDLNSPRMMFLIYEVSFVLLTVCLLRFHENVKSQAWVARVSRFVIVYYSLWATADILILAFGLDVGYLLRVVPNLLYYGGLIAVMGRCAEAAAREAA